MSTNTTLRDKLNARTDDRHRIGTDANDRAHYVDAQLGVVWVTADEEIVHVEATDNVTAWVNFVADDCGWAECRYSEGSFVDTLTDAFREASA